MEHSVLVAQQFGSTAGAYLESVTHASGKDLEWLAAEMATHAGAAVLDLGCGAGHASFAVAPHALSVTAYDPTAEMLEVVRREAVVRGFANIRTVQGVAEALPFPDASFELAVSRYSAHHWHDIPAALKEIRRVLKPAARMLLIDTSGDESPLLDTHLQTIELLRDPSHIRNYTAPEWIAMFCEAGFAARLRDRWPLTLEFSGWIKRIRTPPDRVTAIHAVWAAAPDEVRQSFAVQPDGSFTMQKLLLDAHA
jgi:ubiquinone/menaquinone biosynthesis C-methylase UbiE